MSQGLSIHCTDASAAVAAARAYIEGQPLARLCCGQTRRALMGQSPSRVGVARASGTMRRRTRPPGNRDGGVGYSHACVHVHMLAVHGHPSKGPRSGPPKLPETDKKEVLRKQPRLKQVAKTTHFVVCKALPTIQGPSLSRLLAADRRHAPLSHLTSSTKPRLTPSTCEWSAERHSCLYLVLDALLGFKRPKVHDKASRAPTLSPEDISLIRPAGKQESTRQTMNDNTP